MIEAAEAGTGRTVTELRELLVELGSTSDAKRYHDHGPTTCPHSRFIEKHMDFQVTQVSDCAIISAEVSPAGVINLIHHCWGAAISLLAKGVMVRGYITRGRIYHDGNQFMGSGYHEAYRRESTVQAFKREAHERGTPFIELDPMVADFVSKEGDECVRKMFDRFTKSDGRVTALFPFQRLAHSFIIGGFGYPPFNPSEEKRRNNNLRDTLRKLQEQVGQHVDQSNASAVQKSKYYIDALDAQLTICDRTDEMIDMLDGPVGSRRK